MSAHALAQGSLRPVEALPPTLIPNAIRSSAPRTDRGKSLLASCVIYSCGAMGIFFFLAKTAQEIRKPITTGGGVIVELNPTTIPEVRPLLPPPALPPALRERRDAMTTPVPMPSNVVPETPMNTPTIDRSHEVPIGPENPLMPPGSNTSTITTGNGGGPTSVVPGRILEVSLSSLKVLHQVAPTYPPMARLAKIQGPVTLRMTINEQGEPTLVEVVSTPHVGLNAESLRVAKLWRFEPARMDGKPVSAQFLLTLNYRLSN